MDELARRGVLDDAYYISGFAAGINNQIVNPESNNMMLIGDPTVCQGLLEAVVVRKDSFENLKSCRFFEINTARFAESLAMPGQLESELKQLTTALKSISKRQKVVLALDFQDFYDVYKLKAGMAASLYFQLKEAIEDKSISVVILANHELYEKLLSKDKRLEQTFNLLDLRRPGEYDLLKIALDFARRINSRYQHLLPHEVNVVIERDTVKEALILAQKYYPQGLSVNKFQEVVDKIIIRRLGRAQGLAFRLNQIQERILKAARGLFGGSSQGQQEMDFLKFTLDRLLGKYRRTKTDLEEQEEFVKGIKEKSNGG